MAMLGALPSFSEPRFFDEEPAPLDLALATGASVRSETAQGISSSVLNADAPVIQLPSGLLRKSGDLVVSLAPSLGSQYVPRPEHNQFEQH
jgi:hypothetical protein